MQGVNELPKPHKDSLITLRQHPEKFYATVVFSGTSIPSEALQILFSKT